MLVLLLRWREVLQGVSIWSDQGLVPVVAESLDCKVYFCCCFSIPQYAEKLNSLEVLQNLSFPSSKHANYP